jgi:rhodanese-related sulfurtransferase
MKHITVAELQELIEETPGLHVLDVREQQEYDAVNIGATLLPLSSIRNMDVESIEGWKNDPVVVHCKSGKRSMEACMILESLGFTQPVNLTGGIEAWLAINGDRKIK